MIRQTKNFSSTWKGRHSLSRESFTRSLMSSSLPSKVKMVSAILILRDCLVINFYYTYLNIYLPFVETSSETCLLSLVEMRNNMFVTVSTQSLLELFKVIIRKLNIFLVYFFILSKYWENRYIIIPRGPLVNILTWFKRFYEILFSFRHKVSSYWSKESNSSVLSSWQISTLCSTF